METTGDSSSGLHWCVESNSLLWGCWFYPSLLMDVLDELVDKGVGRCRCPLSKKALNLT